MAVDDLVAVVADHRIQLSPADAETLRALGAGQHGEAPPTSLLAGTILLDLGSDYDSPVLQELKDRIGKS